MPHQIADMRVMEREQRVAEGVACLMAKVEGDLLRLMALQASNRPDLEAQIRTLEKRIQDNKRKAAALWKSAA